MRLRHLAATLALVLSGLPATASGSSLTGDHCADITVRLRNFKIEAKWAKPTVAVGSVAQLKVVVTRTADEDPVTDEGQPYPTGRPMDEPAEDVELSMNLWVGDTFLAAGGVVTDAEGRANLKIKIKNYTKPGMGIGRVYAEKVATPPDFPSSACRVIVYEWGELDPSPKLKVVR